MNQEQTNRFTASFYRQVFLAKMLASEYEYFKNFPAPSGIKNEMHRLSKVYNSGVQNLCAYMPNSKEKFKQHMNVSEERISAMNIILERLSMLEDEKLFELEKDFMKHVTIKY